MTNVLDKKGMGEIRLGDRTTILHGTLENIELYEQKFDGIYSLVYRVGSGNFRATDLINLIWAFSYDRDTEGWTRQEIADVLLPASIHPVHGIEIGKVIQSFLSTLFTEIDPNIEEPVEDTKKKTRRKS